jgi:hypothetical protein
MEKKFRKKQVEMRGMIEVLHITREREMKQEVKERRG